jgi:hypothetical protein
MTTTWTRTGGNSWRVVFDHEGVRAKMTIEWSVPK